MERRRHRRTSRDEVCAGGGPEACSQPKAARDPSGFPLPFPSLLLPSIAFLFLATLLLLLPAQLTAQPVQAQPRPQQRVASQASTRHLINDHKMGSLRPRRQTKPEESIWQLYFRLMSEGNNDTVSAFQQVRQLFSTLIEPERPSENITTTEKAMVTAEVDVGVDEEEGSAAGANETATATTTTTTEPTPRKISTGELMGIFRRNVFGLGRLFGREFWNAIQQSNKNIQTYSREWQEAIRPFVQ